MGARRPVARQPVGPGVRYLLLREAAWGLGVCVCVCARIQRGNKGILLKLEVYLAGEFSCLVGIGTVQGPAGTGRGLEGGRPSWGAAPVPERRGWKHQERQRRAPHVLLQPEIHRLGKGQPGSPSEERGAVLAHIQQRRGSGQGGKAAFELFARGSWVRHARGTSLLPAASTASGPAGLFGVWAVWGLGCLGSSCPGAAPLGSPASPTPCPIGMAPAHVPAGLVRMMVQAGGSRGHHGARTGCLQPPCPRAAQPVPGAAWW